MSDDVNRISAEGSDLPGDSVNDEAGAAPDEVSIDVGEPATPPPTRVPGPISSLLSDRRLMALLVVVLVVLAGMYAAMSGIFEEEGRTTPGSVPHDGNASMPLGFLEPVMLDRELQALGTSTQDIPKGVIGYEPSLAVDSQGNMFYTAHKDLLWQESWDYLASWWFISTDNGQTWRNPEDLAWNAPGVGAKYVWAGDEGDIAVDARDRIYFVDTTLADNNFHVFLGGGDTYEYSKEQGSTLLDDRPWLTAQGDGVLHYLGNNGVSVNGARVWYYRSEDGGLTWTSGEPMVGGWATIDAERFGEHVYVAQVYSDGGEQNIISYNSADGGHTWNGPVYVGPMVANGIGEGCRRYSTDRTGRSS